MKMFDESYRVEIQNWQKWPKTLIMTHKWSTNGHDRRIEQRRYVPDDYATRLEMENYRIKAYAEHRKKLADEEFEKANDIRHNIIRLRDRVHEVAADRDRIKAENTKLKELVLHTVECVRRLSDTSKNGGCVPCPYQSIDYDCEFENRARELGVKVDG